MKSCISEKKRKIYLLSGITFWILFWWVMSIFVGEKLFLPSPFTVIKTMLFLLGEKEFWSDISFSAVRVIISYGLSFVLALAFGIVGGGYEKVDILLSPLVKAMRSIPVASIVILVLLWVKSRNLSLVVSFLVVFPLLYESVLSGMRNTDSLLLEAADNYGIKSSLGLCWKSAMAAEVIGLPSHSIGSRLYEAKVYLDTPSLFAWTVAIVLLAVVFEKLAFLLFSLVKKRVMK